MQCTLYQKNIVEAEKSAIMVSWLMSYTDSFMAGFTFQIAANNLTY